MSRISTGQATLSSGKSMLRGVGSAAIAKVLVMGLTGALGLFTSRIIVQSFGVDAYAQYGLIASLPALLPFADLGIAAVIINAAAESTEPRSDDRLRRTIVSACRVLITSGALIVAVSIAISILGLWPSILGPGLMEGGGWVAGASIALFGIGLPLTIGPRLLVGLGRNTTQIATQALVAPTILVLIGLCVILAVPAAQYLAVFTYVASILVSTVALCIAAKIISPQFSAASREILHPRASPGAPVMNMAWPMLVQMVALPIAMQTSRIVVSHVGDPGQLAQYNLAAQIFSIALQTISASGIALWPVFAKARKGNRIESPMAPTLWFLAGGVTIAAAMAVLSPWLTAFIADGKFQLAPLLVWSFVLFVALQAAKYPIGMYMTDLRGLRFQVIPAIIMVPLSLGISLALVPVLGAAGCVIGVSVAVALCQVIPNMIYVIIDLRERRRQAAAAV